MTIVRSPRDIATSLRAGRCPADRVFDRFLPDDMRTVSGQYWTPVAVAMRAAEWLDSLHIRTVVDIGSGAGKFCVAAALAGRCTFMGLERQSRLVASAQALARLFELDERVRFVEARFGKMPAPVADAYYLYNPFGDYRFGASANSEPTMKRDERASEVAAVEDLLRRAPLGTCLVTYNGFGGKVPEGYTLIRRDDRFASPLRLWIRRADPLATHF